MGDDVVIYTDGAARGNPGPAAFAYVIRQPGVADIEASGVLGETTNNVAEYTALVRALEHARLVGARRLQIYSDSELMIKQMRGEYRVKNEGLRPLYEAAQREVSRFEAVEFSHVGRADNRRADQLCNEALDQASASAPARNPPRANVASAERAGAVREEAIACLRTVAAAWARGNPADPSPEAVWDQLWSLLEEAGLVRSADSCQPQNPGRRRN